jgi:hypothetical protein
MLRLCNVGGGQLRVLSHHILSHSHGAADENLDLHATLSLRHRNSILDSGLHSLSLMEKEAHSRASAHRPYAFMFLFPFCMLTIAGRHGLDGHFDDAFNHGVSA